MHCLSSLWSHRIVLFVVLAIFSLFSCDRKAVITKISVKECLIEVDTVKTISQVKIQLTKEYCEQNYGFYDYLLESPQMIVIHHTVIPTLQETIELFQKDHLNSNRKFINKFSALNVGIHYVIDKDGKIYNLLPDTIIARHVIGFNHVAIGIENVARVKEDLTIQQLESNINLVKFLQQRHSSISYLIGHDEYNDTTLAHYKLFKSLDVNYQPYDKPDPGTKFMENLRSNLKDRHELEFKK